MDKVVVVTGASSGLGDYITRHLVEAGADVVATARRVDRLESLGADLAAAPGSIRVLRADVTSASDARLTMETAINEYGRLDALVNNAGMEVPGPIEELTEADFEQMLRTNVIGPYLYTQAALPYLKRNGGSIVNLGSTVVARAPRFRFGYVASKGALEAMSLALAGDLGLDRIRVNVIRPGIVPSELRGSTETEEMVTMQERVPHIQALEAVGKGGDVAAVVSFLISDAAEWITGAVIDVDGGYSLGVWR
jgi:NAD(P)-dependent dehydrogenase (short-subunit alcohol dehydrogenase family)